MSTPAPLRYVRFWIIGSEYYFLQRTDNESELRAFEQSLSESQYQFEFLWQSEADAAEVACVLKWAPDLYTVCTGQLIWPRIPQTDQIDWSQVNWYQPQNMTQWFHQGQTK
jgi:hypothetical protein